MSTLDLTPIVQPILEIAGTVATGLIAVYVPKLVTAFSTRTGIQLTEQQRQTVLGSVQTAAGEIETMLDQDALQIAHINVANSTVLAKAQAAVDAVPAAAAALGVTPAGMARMIVGAVDTGSRTATAAPAAAPALRAV
jgi:ABC-type uncharacterized transport system YnjBCD ATPase subunit